MDREGMVAAKDGMQEMGMGRRKGRGGCGMWGEKWRERDGKGRVWVAKSRTGRGEVEEGNGVGRGGEGGHLRGGERREG